MRDDETASDSAFASSELWDLVADNPEALSDADSEGVSRDIAHPGLTGRYAGRYGGVGRGG